MGGQGPHARPCDVLQGHGRTFKGLIVFNFWSTCFSPLTISTLDFVLFLNWFCNTRHFLRWIWASLLLVQLARRFFSQTGIEYTSYSVIILVAKLYYNNPLRPVRFLSISILFYNNFYSMHFFICARLNTPITGPGAYRETHDGGGYLLKYFYFLLVRNT